MITTSTIYSNTKNLNDNNGLLDVAMECAGFLDQVGAFAFKDWINGELIEGPKLEKFFVCFKLMFPEDLTPDPAVIERLTNLGCKVKLEKDIYRRVANVRSADTKSSFSSEGFEKRMFEHNVWVVDIKVPERFLALDGNTMFKIDDEFIPYHDIEAYYVNGEVESMEGETDTGSPLGGDDEGFDF